MGARLAGRLRRSPHSPSAEELRERVARAVAALGERVARCDFVDVPARSEPWLDSGIVFAAGQAVTLLAVGRVFLSRLFDVGFGPGVGLWHRIGDGEVEKTGTANTFVPARGGALWLTTKPPGEFADRRGAFEATPPRAALAGAFTLAVIQWRGDAVQALAAAAEIDAALFEPARRVPTAPPPGWHPLWRLGPSEIFTTADDGSLCCRPRSDAGILQFPVRRALGRDTRLAWSWRVDALPSRLPEHIQPTHDYLSIAVEFEDGRDLTYLWSAALPVGTIFQCPLPWWDQRETHWVVQSGARGLGNWAPERRNVLADCERALGGPPPREIVGVWLIAVSVFQGGEGSIRYRGIVLEDDAGRAVVHP